MSFEKVVAARIFGVTNQNSDTRMTVGDSSSGTFTRIVNPLRGTLFWDRCMYVLQGVSVAGGATGGSYTVTIQTDAVAGYTGLPIATANIGPLTPRTVVLSSSHQSPSSPLPTHIFIDQTAAGGGIWLQCFVVAKQYRGTLGTPGAATSERILQGTMLRGSAAGGFADGRGFDEDATMTLGTTGSTLGMNRMRLWDNALYWAVAGNSVAGTHDVDVVGRVGGNTVTIARTGTAGTITAAGQKTALANLFFGQSPNPTQIIWTEVSAGGVSDARVVMIAKGGRGSMAKN